MNYCTLEDVRGHVPESRLVEVTDDLRPAAGGSVIETVVDKAIVESSRLIDTYIGKRFRLPLPAIPQVLNMIAIDLTIYNLYERVTEMNVSEGMTRRYDNAVAILKRIASGEADLGLAASENVEETSFRTVAGDEGVPAIFTMGSMRSL